MYVTIVHHSPHKGFLDNNPVTLLFFASKVLGKNYSFSFELSNPPYVRLLRSHILIYQTPPGKDYR